MNRKALTASIHQQRTFLCIGLDSSMDKLPEVLKGRKKGIFEFNKQIIDATKDLCIGYKINTAFYEAMGSKGWEAMEETVHYIPKTHFKIADAKRGDIGNTATQYAKAFFETMPFDAITVAPYMGEDSIRPFLEFENKWTIVLALTSNAGAQDFEMLKMHENTESISPRHLYEIVVEKISRWGNTDNLMFVAGATQTASLKSIRAIVPNHFLLVPGVGFQGGSLQEVSKEGMNADCGLLVNVSRAILYAGKNEDFAVESRAIAQQYQAEMANYLKEYTP